MKNNKGQIMFTTLTIAGSVIVAIIGAWGTVASKTAKIDKQVSIVEERENNHYLEVKTKLERIDEKLDRILEK